MGEHTRIDDLRRRVLQDPASIAFAQLAEEYRRTGQFAQAVDTCRAGLALHPGYLSARVTLGRALLALERLDDAHTELRAVLAAAPENLAATRALADISRRQGRLADAVDHYSAALRLAPNDPDLERIIADLTHALAGQQQTSTHVEHARAAATIAALETWLEAIHVARADRNA